MSGSKFVTASVDEVEEFGRKARYFNTFGGNTVAIAAASAVLDVIETEGLMQNTATVGAYLASGLRDLATRFPVIGDVRGAGLFLGVEMVKNRSNREPDPDAAAEAVDGLREKGVLISATGPDANILKIRPALVFTRANADIFVDKLEQVLAGANMRR